MYEDYLIVTGDATGYYVHTEADGDNYIKEVTLRYEYDTEDSSKVNYVIYNDSVSVNSDEGGTHRLGVNKDSFNYSKSAINYTQLITKKEMSTESISVRWEKVSKATDLSYVTEKLGNLKYYEYSSFASRGIYELTPMDTTEGANEYLYYYMLIDTAKDSYRATAYYQLKDSDEQVKETVSGDSAPTSTSGQLEYNGTVFSYVMVSSIISEEYLTELINARLPQSAE